MHAAHYSSLLPEVFRHKTTQVRVPRPKIILLDFHGTISERRWEDRLIYPYVKQAVGAYLQNNWTNDVVQRCLPGLRNESFEQRFRNKFEDAPVISEPVNGEDDADEAKNLAAQMSDFLVWQMNTKKETNETQTIERLVWQDGLRHKKLFTPIYDDVLQSIRVWHDKYHIPVYVISSLEHDTLRLLFENTDKGNLDRYIRAYVSTKSGDKLLSDTYKAFYGRLHLNSVRSHSPKDSQPGHRNGGSNHHEHHEHHLRSQSSQSYKSGHLMTSPTSQQTLSSSTLNSSFDGIAKPVMFLTDSGQEAKAASQVDDGHAFECLLVNRPGNKRIRTYYLSQFQYIEKFDDIEFVK